MYIYIYYNIKWHQCQGKGSILKPGSIGIHRDPQHSPIPNMCHDASWLARGKKKRLESRIWVEKSKTQHTVEEILHR